MNSQKRQWGLSLTRRIGESILIMTSDGPVRITLSGIMGGRARIEFSSPHKVGIYRQEAWEKNHPGQQAIPEEDESCGNR